MKCIGMDAHSNTCFFVVMNSRGKIVARRRVSTDEGKILAFVRSVKGKKKLAFEEGVLSQWLYLLLKDEVDELVVCQPSEHDGAKTDEKDTIQIADDLRTNRLKKVFHSDNEFMNLRALVSGYDDLMSILNGEKNRLNALFRQSAIPTNDKKFYETPEKAFLLPTVLRSRYLSDGADFFTKLSPKSIVSPEQHNLVPLGCCLSVGQLGQGESVLGERARSSSSKVLQGFVDMSNDTCVAPPHSRCGW